MNVFPKKKADKIVQLIEEKREGKQNHKTNMWKHFDKHLPITCSTL